ncbi:MAG TPA: DUF4339 domain-containing protein [Tepidisphaeraceae bacterium]|jgi:hypothetical protein
MNMPQRVQSAELPPPAIETTDEPVPAAPTPIPLDYQTPASRKAERAKEYLRAGGEESQRFVYYVLHEDERRGPFSLEELAEMDITPDTPVLREAWLPAGSMAELHAYFLAHCDTPRIEPGSLEDPPDAMADKDEADDPDEIPGMREQVLAAQRPMIGTTPDGAPILGYQTHFRPGSLGAGRGPRAGILALVAGITSLALSIAAARAIFFGMVMVWAPHRAFLTVFLLSMLGLPFVFAASAISRPSRTRRLGIAGRITAIAAPLPVLTALLLQTPHVTDQALELGVLALVGLPLVLLMLLVIDGLFDG